MKIVVTCKLTYDGVLGFLKPMSDIENVQIIRVFRDDKAKPYNKIIYFTPPLKINVIIKQLSKLFQMVYFVKRETRLIIGIYELPHGLLAFIIGKLKRIPIVITLISNPGYKKIRKGLWKATTNVLLRNSDFVTVTGTRSKQFIVNEGIQASKILILPNSIDTNIFKPKNVKKKYDIISVGYLDEAKVPYLIIDAVLRLIIDYPRIKVAIAGDGPMKQLLQEMITQKNIGKHIELIGYVDDIVEFYNSGKVFMFTSTTEGLPRTIIESMSCGVPVIASNVGDIGDIVKHGKNGYLIEQNNLNDFVEKIKILFNNDILYKSFVEHGITHVNDNYTYASANKVWKLIFNKINKK